MASITQYVGETFLQDVVAFGRGLPNPMTEATIILRDPEKPGRWVVVTTEDEGPEAEAFCTALLDGEP